MGISKVKNLIPAPEDGTDAVTYEILPSVAVIHADKDGNVLTGAIDVRAYKNVNGVRTLICSALSQGAFIDDGDKGDPTYYVQYKVDNNSWTPCETIIIGGGVQGQIGYGVPATATASITTGIAFRMVYGFNSNSSNVVYEMGALPVVKDGQTGAAGAVGKFYYPDGEYDPYTEYFSSSNSAPYVYVVRQENNIPKTYYYMLVAGSNRVNGELVAPGEDSSIWEIMHNDFKYLVSEMIFSMFAHMGSAIFCGDWMFSQHGVLGGATSTLFRMFDPAYPDTSVNTTHNVNGEEWNGYNFVPNYAVDLLRGKVYMADAVVSGTVKTKSFKSEFADISQLPNGSLFVVGVDTVVNGNNIEGIWNFKAKYQTVLLPTNLYAHYGQRVIIYNTSTYLGGGNGTIIECGVYDQSEGLTLTTQQALRGVGMPDQNRPGVPVPMNQYDFVGSIEILDGIIELMCVPSDDPDRMCDWCVINIGTNIYKLYRL